ncbi:2Fe-2S iron-sulfur cluster-binding protein [Kaarinaea lacus]
MSYLATLTPSGHTFNCEENESVLDAALRSGINLSYHCTTGSCGECKAKLIEGRVEDYRHYDFVIPEAEKMANTVLLCSVSAASDLIIEAREAVDAGDIPLQQIAVKIARIDRVNDSNLVLHLRTPRSKTLRFLAGQYIEAKISDGTKANFYIASCPCNGMVVQLHIQRTDSAFSRYAFQQLKVGDSLEINGPFGDFTLNEASRRPIVMVAQESGFAPLKSLIEHAIALDLPQSMHLFWMVGNGQVHYQDNYCRSWEDALDCFVYHPFELQELGNGENDYQAAAAFVLGRTPVESEIDLYLAGSNRMLEFFRGAFLQKGTPANKILMAKPA